MPKRKHLAQGYPIGDFAEIGPKGGIKESEKGPKSNTPNPNPKGEGTVKVQDHQQEVLRCQKKWKKL